MNQGIYSGPQMKGRPSVSLAELLMFGVVIVVAAAFIGLEGVSLYGSVATHRTETFTVEKSERINEGRSSRYLIFTDRGVYENTDSLVNGKFNSSDVYSQLEAGSTYACDVTGWRVPFLSWYPNVIACEAGRVAK